MRILHFYFSRKFYILLSSDLIFSDFSETQTTVSQNAPPPLCCRLFVVIRCKISLTILLSNKTFTHSFSFSLLDSLRHSEATPTLPVCYHTDISLFSSSLRRRPHSQNISVLFLNLSHMRKVSVIKSVWFRC